MSISKPQNRQEFKDHILIKLGAPVLEINVADEQLDIAIDDAFQYFNERNHFNGVERMYLVIDLDNPNVRQNYTNFCTYNTDYVNECGNVSTPTPTPPSTAPMDAPVEGPTTSVYHTARRQSNFVVLPDDVVGVEEVLRSNRGMGGMIGGLPGMGFPGLIGTITGQECDNNGFGLSQYYAYMEYRALVDFLFFPPKMYNFNQRTHRLWIDGDTRDLRGTLALQCMVKPNPDVFPDLWNDMWLKEMTKALVQAQWGRNLTKYNQVQLPGGLTLNGDRILQDAQEELKTIKDRFSMDFMDPPLDMVG